jgi:hypothetical protein
MPRNFLLASGFDRTLSFNDSGVVLSELIGFHGSYDKIKDLAEINLVQQDAELRDLILHDPDFRRVRREHLVETGRRIRLKDVVLFARVLDNLGERRKFNFKVISAARQKIIAGQVVISYTVLSHASGVNNLTKSAKRLARGLGRSRPQTLRCRNRLYRQHLADMSFRIDWQTACGINNRGGMEL